MKKNTILILFIFFALIGSEGCFAASYLKDSKSTVAPNPIFQKTVTVPIGKVLTIGISNEINSSTAQLADTVYAVLKNDFYYNGKMVAQEGSTVMGMITKVSAPKGDKPAEMLIKFTNIVTPTNQNIPISAVIKTYDKSGILYGNDMESIVITADSTLEIIIMQPVTYIPD